MTDTTIDDLGPSGEPVRRAPARPARRAGMTGSIAERAHRWFGLVLGAVLAMAGLTGSYLAFYPELERAAIAPLRQSSGERPESVESLYRALTRIAAPTQGSWSIELPEDGGVVTSRFSQRGREPRMVSLDPVTLTVVRDEHWGETLSTWLYELHTHLLLDRANGAPLMGGLAIGMIAMIVLGILLWWRSGRSWRSRLRFAGGTGERKVYDLHRLAGIAASALLLTSLVTAAMMSLPKQVRPLVEAVSALPPAPKPHSAAAAGRARIAVDRAIAAVERHLPGADVRWIAVPARPDGAYAIRYWQPGEPSQRFPRSTIWIDQYDGRVLAHRRLSDDTGGNQLLGWLYGIHSGQALGTVGRGLVALLGLVPALLFITGLIRWRSKAARLAAHRRRT